MTTPAITKAPIFKKAEPEPVAAPAPEPEPAPIPHVDLQVGQLVLFTVGGGGLYPPVVRPLIVTSFTKIGDSPIKVRGLLIFDSETDRHQPWVQLISKVTPLVTSPICWAEGPYGHNVGEWRYPGDLR